MIWKLKKWNTIKLKLKEIGENCDVTKKALNSKELKLLDRNEMIYIYKKELELLKLGVYFTQYYFTTSSKNRPKKLNKKNLLNSFRNSFLKESLEIFLRDNPILKLNEFGHFVLFDILNSREEQRLYQIKKFEFLLGIW